MLQRNGSGRAATGFIFVTVLLDMMAIGIIAPVLPKLVAIFTGGNLANAALYIGLFATVWAMMQFFCSPLLGMLSDRVGRRPVILLSNGVTAEETKILHENVESGTATRSAIDCPTAAKTGTTSELVDAWLDGYTPHYSTVVWMGYPNKRVSMTDVHGEPQQGGYLPAEIWHAYMSMVTEGQKCSEFPAATEPLVYQPFFGKYASTGRSSQGTETGEESFGGKENKQEKKNLAKAKLPHTNNPGQETGGGGAGGGGGGTGGGGGGAIR